MFSFAQLFHIDSARVDLSSVAYLSKVDLYFHSKPSIEGNKSGIYAPGIEIYICPVKNNIPWIDAPELLYNKTIARKEYSDIYTSSNASRATTFEFPTPVKLYTDVEYALIIKTDGNEDFTFAINRTGSLIIGSNAKSTGPSGTNIGDLYHYINSVTNVNNNVSNNNSVFSSNNANSSFVVNDEYYENNWKSLTNTVLKIGLYVARFSHNGIPILANNTLLDDPLSPVSNVDMMQVLSNNVIRITCPAIPQEYIAFDRKQSNTDGFRYGDIFFQKQQYYPAGSPTPATVSVSTSDKIVRGNTSYLLANGSPINFNSIFYRPDYITVISLDHYGANQHAVNVKKVTNISNDSIYVDSAFTFTNSEAYFYNAPVGRLIAKERTFLNGEFMDFVVLTESSAHYSNRFVNSCIDSYVIAANGTGYSNTDRVIVTGFEYVTGEQEGGYEATANVRTNSNGSLTGLYFGNVGAGFANVANISYTIVNSSNVSSNGTGANLSFVVDSIIYNEFGALKSYLKGAEIVNLETTQIVPEVLLTNPSGTLYNLFLKTQYYYVNTSNTNSGVAYYINPNSALIDLKHLSIQEYNTANTPIIPSRSNEFSIRYANGAYPNTSITGTSFTNAACFIIDTVSNNDFVSVILTPQKLSSHYAKYSINNDYTNEHTNYGNAYAKHVSEKVTFSEGRFAEDLVVYLTGYRPANTDFKVYARMHNSHDGEAFDDKDWTLLEQIDGLGVYSSLTDPTDLKEFTYGIPLYPNSEFTCSGTCSIVANTANVIGSNTTFTANLSINDVVKVYDPLFPNNYSISVVNSVVNNTLLTLKSAIANVSQVGSGLKIDKIGYPQQAFRYHANENVARYYSSSRVEYDTYDTLQLKIIFLSTTDHIIPKIDDVQGVGVTA